MIFTHGYYPWFTHIFPHGLKAGHWKIPMFWGHGGSFSWAGCLAPETPEPARSVIFVFFFWRKKKQKLVGSFKHEFYVPENIWDGIILPIHELIFFKMVKTTNQKRHVRASDSCIMVALCCAKAIVDLSKGRFQVFFVGCVPKDWIFQICHFWGWRVCSTDQVRCNCNFVPTLFELEH